MTGTPRTVQSHPRCFQMNDQQKLIDAVDKAAFIIAEHIEPQTINRLIEVLDNQDVAPAVERLKSGFGLKVVK